MDQKFVDVIKNKWVAITFIILVVAAFLWVYFSGKKSGKDEAETNKFPSVFDIPVDSPGQVELTQAEKNLVRAMTNRLYDDLEGLGFYHDYDIYTDFLAMSDSLFVSVYNDFNTLHEGEGEGTLRMWIQDDSLYGSIIQSVFDRMDRLALP
jgi:hypothetical protein